MKPASPWSLPGCATSAIDGRLKHEPMRRLRFRRRSYPCGDKAVQTRQGIACLADVEVQGWNEAVKGLFDSEVVRNFAIGFVLGAAIMAIHIAGEVSGLIA